MSDPSDYLAIAYLISVHPMTQNAIAMPDSFEAAHAHLVNYYGRDFSIEYTRLALNKLDEWEFIQVVSDPYAGDLIISHRSEIAQPIGKLIAVSRSGLYNAAINGGNDWFKRVFANADYWQNFERESERTGEHSAEELEFSTAVPASDRVVRLDHNQVAEIEHPLTDLIGLVEPENSIGDEGGLRELILGKLRAGRELIRAGIFSLQSLHLTLVVGLNMLIEKHKDTAISVAAAKLLDLLLAQYGVG